MAASTSNINNTHTYSYNRGCNTTEIEFYLNDQGALSVIIKTEILYMRSTEAKEQDYNNYADLFGDQDVMKKFGDGQTKTAATIKEYVDKCAKRWSEKNPFSGLSVFKNDQTADFLGHVTLGYGNKAGQCKLGYLFVKKHWEKGYATEAVSRVVKEYAPAIIKEGYLVEGKPLERISATARLDNLASSKILEKVGMKLEKKGRIRSYATALFHQLWGVSS